MFTQSRAETPLQQFAQFEQVIVDDSVSDSYFTVAVDVNNDKRPDIVRAGLGNPGADLAELVWYENPSWSKRSIRKMSVPVGLSVADIDQDGAEDLVVSHDYEFCIFGCEADNGRVSWLRNPGKEWEKTTWQRYFIGDLMTTHRLRVGSFTKAGVVEVLAFPVTGGVRGDIHAPADIRLFRRPEAPLGATEWPGEPALRSMRLLHGETVKRFHNDGPPGTDSLLLASEDGITWMYYDQNGMWKGKSISAGELGQVDASPSRFKGSGDVDCGRRGKDQFNYIVAQEPFHGSVVALYTKENPDAAFRDAKWKRVVIDNYGEPNDRGEGPIHHVLCGNFDQDEDDEFVVALRGPNEWNGVFLYDFGPDGNLRRQQLSTISASRLALTDFDGDGRLDIVSVPYVVSTYYRAPVAKILLLRNRGFKQ